MISIIIPIHNEEKYIAQCLNSLLEQLISIDEYEIFCVDGLSVDNTKKIILEYTNQNNRIYLLENKNKILSSAMNIALRFARGDYIYMLGSHVKYGVGYIQECLDLMVRKSADVVGGYVETVPGINSQIGIAISAATTCRFGVGGASFRIGGEEKEVDTVPYGCYRRDVFERFGMFDERLVRNQDIELNSRIRRGGGKIIISPKIRSKYYTRSTFRGLRQQAFNNGLWNPYTVYLTGGGLRLRHFAPLGFVSSLFFLTFGGFFWKPFWMILSVEMIMYIVAGMNESIKAAKKTNTSAALIFLSFVQLHLSYGIGSLWGVITAPFKFGLRPSRQSTGKPIKDRID